MYFFLEYPICLLSKGSDVKRVLKVNSMSCYHGCSYDWIWNLYGCKFVLKSNCAVASQYNGTQAAWFCFRSATSRTWGHGHAAQRPQWTATLPEPCSCAVEPLQVLQCRAETWQAGRTLQSWQHSTGTDISITAACFTSKVKKKIETFFRGVFCLSHHQHCQLSTYIVQAQNTP